MKKTPKIDKAPFKRAWRKVEKVLIPLSSNLLRSKREVLPNQLLSHEDQIGSLLNFDLAIDPLGLEIRPIIYNDDEVDNWMCKDVYFANNFASKDDAREFARLDDALGDLIEALNNWHETVLDVAKSRGIVVDDLHRFDPRSTIADYALWESEHHRSASSRVHTWSTTCLAPLDLLRYTAQQLQYGDSDELSFLLSIASGWVAVNVSDKYQKKIQVESFLNNADILSNIVMALGDSNALPAIFVDGDRQRMEAKIHSEIDVNRFSLRISRPTFRCWLEDFKNQTFRELHLFAQRENSHRKKRLKTSSLSNDEFDNLLHAHSLNISEDVDDPTFKGVIRRTTLRAAIDQLTARQLEVLYRRARGETIEEIANDLGVKRSTVETHIKRARKKAKEIASL